MIYEHPLPIMMAKYIKEGDIVVDIGANQGQYTIFLSKLVGQKGKVYAFEPDPRNFLIGAYSVLTKNIPSSNITYGVPAKVIKKNE
jgi:FkbM family methyltransferase